MNHSSWKYNQVQVTNHVTIEESSVCTVNGLHTNAAHAIHFLYEVHTLPCIVVSLVKMHCRIVEQLYTFKCQGKSVIQ